MPSSLAELSRPQKKELVLLGISKKEGGQMGRSWSVETITINNSNRVFLKTIFCAVQKGFE
jgi:hypothetical protein